MKALRLGPCQSVYVQPRKWSGGHLGPDLQGLQLVASLVEEFGEVHLESGYLSGRLHRVHTKHKIVHVCWRGYSTPPLNDRS